MPGSQSANWLAAASRRASFADIRISDAERAEVADLLSAHYEDGRLDQAEFDQRLDQAMKARTYHDLSGLFNDLPLTGASGASGESGESGGFAGPPGTGPGGTRGPSGTEGPGTAGGPGIPAQPGLPRCGGRGRRLLFLALVVAAAAIAGHAVAALTPWLWIGLVCAVVLLVTRPPGRRP